MLTADDRHAPSKIWFREEANSQLGAGFGIVAGCFATGGAAVFLDGERFGARFRVPRGIVAGCFLPMARRNVLPEVDSMDEPRIRRAAIYFLSATVVDAGSGVDAHCAVAVGARLLRNSDADAGGTIRVSAVAKINKRARRAAWSGVLRGESERAADYLCAKRFCGATGMRILSTIAAGCTTANGSL